MPANACCGLWYFGVIWVWYFGDSCKFMENLKFIPTYIIIFTYTYTIHSLCERTMRKIIFDNSLLSLTSAQNSLTRVQNIDCVSALELASFILQRKFVFHPCVLRCWYDTSQPSPESRLWLSIRLLLLPSLRSPLHRFVFVLRGLLWQFGKNFILRSSIEIWDLLLFCGYT